MLLCFEVLNLPCSNMSFTDGSAKVPCLASLLHDSIKVLCITLLFEMAYKETQSGDDGGVGDKSILCSFG